MIDVNQIAEEVHSPSPGDFLAVLEGRYFAGDNPGGLSRAREQGDSLIGMLSTDCGCFLYGAV
jgi:hypothetical protein